MGAASPAPLETSPGEAPDGANPAWRSLHGAGHLFPTGSRRQALGEGRPNRGRPMRLRADEHSVTAVLGTIMVLGITVVGIAGILLWGAPAIARVQAQNAQLQMMGEFEDLRASSQELSVPDHSRFPTVVVSAGSLSMEPGTRIMVTADHHPTQPACDFRVTRWADTAQRTQATVTATGCAVTLSTTSLQIVEVTGSNTVAKAFTYDSGTGVVTVTSSGADLSEGDWAFFLLSGTDIVAESWLISTDRLSWDLEAAQDRSVYLDAGAVFTASDGTIFLHKPASLGDSSFGPGYVGLWLRTLDTANAYSEISGQGSYQVYLSLVGNHLRIDETGVYRVRYDFAGDLAESWCSSLILRNDDLGSAAAYTEDPSATCEDGDSDGARSVIYAHTASPAESFEYRYLQAEIYASLVA